MNLQTTVSHAFTPAGYLQTPKTPSEKPYTIPTLQPKAITTNSSYLRPQHMQANAGITPVTSIRAGNYSRFPFYPASIRPVRLLEATNEIGKLLQREPVEMPMFLQSAETHLIKSFGDIRVGSTPLKDLYVFSLNYLSHGITASESLKNIKSSQEGVVFQPKPLAEILNETQNPDRRFSLHLTMKAKHGEAQPPESNGSSFDSKNIFRPYLDKSQTQYAIGLTLNPYLLETKVVEAIKSTMGIDSKNREVTDLFNWLCKEDGLRNAMPSF